MTFRSYRASEDKIRKIWDESTLNQIELDQNNNFEPIDIEKSIKYSKKTITRIPIVTLGSNIWYGSVTLENFTEDMLDSVFPLAVFKFIDQNVNVRQILQNGDPFEVFEGALYYWFNKLENNKYVFRFAIDATIDTDEDWGLDFSLVFYNKRIYDNIQKKKQ